MQAAVTGQEMGGVPSDRPFQRGLFDEIREMLAQFQGVDHAAEEILGAGVSPPLEKHDAPAQGCEPPGRHAARGSGTDHDGVVAALPQCAAFNHGLRSWRFGRGAGLCGRGAGEGLAPLQAGDQFGQHAIQVAHDSQIGGSEDGGLRV